jgi:hypothetical protein
MSERFLPARFQDTVAHEPHRHRKWLDVVADETLKALVASPALLEKQHGSQAVINYHFIDDEGALSIY